VSDPYEAPAAPDLTIKSAEEEPLDSARKVIDKLEFFGYLKPLAEGTGYQWGTR
jgi:adenylylsulfate kinase-like enzyme